MNDEPTIAESLDLAQDYLERLGDSVEDKFEGRADGGLMRGLVCEHGHHNFLVMAAEKWEWIQLRYPVNIDQLYAIRRLDSNNTSSDVALSDAQIQQARKEFDSRLNEMPKREKREFRMNMIHMLSRESTMLEFDTTTPLNIHGFNLEKKLFIHDNGFTLGDFSEGLQRVINLGWVGREFILDNYGFRPRENPSDEFSGGQGPNV